MVTATASSVTERLLPDLLRQPYQGPVATGPGSADDGQSPGPDPLGSDRSFAITVVSFYREHGFAIAWTASNQGDEAKRVKESWPKTARAVMGVNGNVDNAAGIFSHRIKTRNPVVVARPDDKNARPLFLVEVDGADDLGRFRSYGAPETLTVRSSSEDKLHFYFRPPADGLRFAAARFEAGTLHMDANRYLVAPPALHPSGVQYRFLDRKVPIATLPREVYDRLVSDFGQQDEAARTALRDDPDEKIKQGARHRRLLGLAGALRRQGVSEDIGLQTLLAFNKERCEPPKADTLVEALVRDVWQRYSAADDPEFDSEFDFAVPARAVATVVTFPELSDDGMGQHFVRSVGKSYRYVVGVGWIVYGGDGGRWSAEAGDKLAKQSLTELLRDLPQVVSALPPDNAYRVATEKFANTRAKKALRDGALSFAEHDPRMLTRLEKLDRNDWLLSVGNGTLELRTGELREGRPDDYITLGSRVCYREDARSALWEDRFLPEVFRGDEELVRYVQRLCGLCLTGTTKDEMLWLLFGRGRNGKGTLTNTLRAVLGHELSRSIDFASLTVGRFSDGSSPSPDIARLRGARLVVASEKHEQRIIDEERIKKLTGGDPIVARGLHQDPIEFTPNFKLVLAVNQKPHMNAADDAVRQRIALVPFDARFVREDGTLDETLKERLLAPAELEGVLAWCVRGTADYLENGIGTCQAVERATTSFLEEMNPLASFFTQCCVLEKGVEVEGHNLRAAYEDYCRETGENRLSDVDYSEAMEAAGLTRRRTNSGNVWHGVELRGSEVPHG
jgi:P4 family phage/plasmid primase-like protien